MRVIVITALLACLISSASANVPKDMSDVLARRCTRCHDKSHDIDLTTSPAADRVDLWRKIFAEVSSHRMPPPEQGSIKRKFPLDNAERELILNGITRLLGPALDEPRRTPHMPEEVWIAAVREIAEAVVPAGQLEEALGPGFFDVYIDALTPIGQVMIDNVSLGVCQSMASAELRPRAKRRYLAAQPERWGTQPSVEQLDSLIRPIFEAAYRRPPSATELTRDRAFLARLRKRAAGWTDAWTGLCTSYLSGPRLLHFGYVSK